MPPSDAVLATTTARFAASSPAASHFVARALKATAVVCLTVVAIGQMLLALYVIAFYGRAALQGRFEEWNKVLPNGYEAGAVFLNLLLGLHLAFAVVIIVGGTLQLLPQLRQRWPRFHRWNGRVYLLAALVMSVGGVILVWSHADKGDPYQHASITLNAVLILLFGAFALRAALARRFDEHRRWALRLYLAVGGVWFFRVGLMFWILVNGGPVGFDPATFRGPALVVIAIAQYALPLAVLELYFRAKATPSTALRLSMTIALAVLTLALVVGIAGAGLMLWLPRVA